MPEQIGKPTYQSENQKITDKYLKITDKYLSRFQRIASSLGVEPYDPDPLWEIMKKLVEIEAKLDQIAVLAQAPYKGGHLLINKIWRRR